MSTDTKDRNEIEKGRLKRSNGNVVITTVNSRKMENGKWEMGNGDGIPLVLVTMIKIMDEPNGMIYQTFVWLPCFLVNCDWEKKSDR